MLSWCQHNNFAISVFYFGIGANKRPHLSVDFSEINVAKVSNASATALTRRPLTTPDASTKIMGLALIPVSDQHYQLPKLRFSFLNPNLDQCNKFMKL